MAAIQILQICILGALINHCTENYAGLISTHEPLLLRTLSQKFELHNLSLSVPVQASIPLSVSLITGLPGELPTQPDHGPPEESLSEHTGPDHSPGTPSAEKRIQRDFSDDDSEGVEVNSPAGSLSSPRPSNESPMGVVEWRASVNNAVKQEATIPPAMQAIPVTPRQPEATATTSKVAPSNTSKGAVLSPNSSMSRVSVTQGYPAITLVTEPAEESEGVERGSNGGPSSSQPHPWSSSLQVRAGV